MFTFKDDAEALGFLAKFVSSETWKWFEQVIRAKFDTVLAELNNPKTTADGRAMLTGRLIELKYVLDFPVKSFEYFRGMEALKKELDADKLTSGQKDRIIAKTAFPEIVTH